VNLTSLSYGLCLPSSEGEVRHVDMAVAFECRYQDSIACFAFGIDRASVTTFCHWRQFQNCFIRIHRAHAYRFFECMHSRNIIQTRLTKQTNRHRPKHTSKYNIQYVHPIRSSVSLLRLYHSAYSAHCRSSDKDGINGNPALGCREVVEGPLDP
jgi:hypothetical protein